MECLLQLGSRSCPKRIANITEQNAYSLKLTSPGGATGGGAAAGWAAACAGADACGADAGGCEAAEGGLASPEPP